MTLVLASVCLSNCTCVRDAEMQEKELTGMRLAAPCSPWLVVFPPCPALVRDFHLCCGHFAGSTRPSDSLPAFMPRLWLITFPGRPVHSRPSMLRAEHNVRSPVSG